MEIKSEKIRNLNRARAYVSDSSHKKEVEIVIFLDKVGIDNRNFNDIIRNFYLHSGYPVNIKDLYNNYKFILYTLNCYGYSREEIEEFLIKNVGILCSNYASLLTKLSILFNFGYFEKAFFENNDIVSMKDVAVSSKDLYAYLAQNEIIDFDTLKDKIILGRVSKLIDTKKYDLTTELKNEFYASLKEYLLEQKRVKSLKK